MQLLWISKNTFYVQKNRFQLSYAILYCDILIFKLLPLYNLQDEMIKLNIQDVIYSSFQKFYQLLLFPFVIVLHHIKRTTSLSDTFISYIKQIKNRYNGRNEYIKTNI